MTEAEIIACPWHEPGGVEAAETICAFLQDIGITIEVAKIETPMFVPGLAIVEGRLLVDPDIASWPGDLLHEAGHIAVVDPERRATLTEVGDDGGDEMTTIAWSVAATKASDIALNILFHPAGYKGGSQSLIENFSRGNTFGVPLLAWYGMTTEAAYPEMTRWLR